MELLGIHFIVITIMLLAIALEIITILVSEMFCLHINTIIMVGYNTNSKTNHFID